MINRLRGHLHELDPDHDPKPGSLTRVKTRRALARWLDDRSGMVARMAREILDDLDHVNMMVDALEREIDHRVQVLAPALLSLPGCGPLTAAKLVAETAGIQRFRSEACFAMHTGVAPIPVWSGNTNG